MNANVKYENLSKSDVNECEWNKWSDDKQMQKHSG